MTKRKNPPDPPVSDSEVPPFPSWLATDTGWENDLLTNQPIGHVRLPPELARRIKAAYEGMFMLYRYIDNQYDDCPDMPDVDLHLIAIAYALACNSVDILKQICLANIVKPPGMTVKQVIEDDPDRYERAADFLGRA